MADAKMLLADTACPPPPWRTHPRLSRFVNFEASLCSNPKALSAILDKVSTRLRYKKFRSSGTPSKGWLGCNERSSPSEFIVAIDVDHRGDNEASLSSCDATMAYRIPFADPPRRRGEWEELVNIVCPDAAANFPEFREIRWATRGERNGQLSSPK